MQSKSRQTRRAMRTAAALPSTEQVQPVRDGAVRPLNVCRGCKDPTAARRRASGPSTSLPTAPLVCRMIFPCHSLPPARFAARACRVPRERFVPPKSRQGCRSFSDQTIRRGDQNQIRGQEGL